jgi:hypothetical protein
VSRSAVVVWEGMVSVWLSAGESGEGAWGHVKHRVVQITVMDDHRPGQGSESIVVEEVVGQDQLEQRDQWGPAKSPTEALRMATRSLWASASTAKAAR